MLAPHSNYYQQSGILVDHYIYDESEFYSNDEYPTEDVQKFYNLYDGSQDLDPPEFQNTLGEILTVNSSNLYIR